MACSDMLGFLLRKSVAQRRRRCCWPKLLQSTHSDFALLHNSRFLPARRT